MSFAIDRRSIVLAGAFGLGALTLGGPAAAQALVFARGFTHGVASGEPGQDSMLLWTRYAGGWGDSEIVLRAEVAEDEGFARIVSGGVVRTGPWRDWTAKLTVDGLKPGRRYFYRFVAPDGAFSPVGQTKTLPEDQAERFVIGLFSCANLPYGYFNAYAHAADRGDIDLVVHVGDYLYEMQRGAYPAMDQVVGGRIIDPPAEIVHLEDYRIRYAAYRADPDLQRLHRLCPFLVQMDDHESANDSWEGGAGGHQPDMEGLWSTRRLAAMQAWREWMPVSDEPWKSYRIGRLATLYRTDSRLLARTAPPGTTALFKEADPVAALKGFRDGPWRDPSSSMLGSTQEVWLSHEMKAAARETAWQIVGMGTIMGFNIMPPEALGWLSPDTAEGSRGYVTRGVEQGKLGLPVNLDNWGGYPAARARFLKAAQAADADLVMLSGDSHNGWAFNLAQDGEATGVEIAGHSVTSPGFENTARVDPNTVARGMVAANPELQWMDSSRRGYVAVTVTQKSVTGEWLLLDTIKEKSTRMAGSHRMTVMRGKRLFAG